MWAVHLHWSVQRYIYDSCSSNLQFYWRPLPTYYCTKYMRCCQENVPLVGHTRWLELCFFLRSSTDQLHLWVTQMPRTRRFRNLWDKWRKVIVCAWIWGMQRYCIPHCHSLQCWSWVISYLHDIQTSHSQSTGSQNTPVSSWRLWLKHLSTRE